MVHSNVLQIDRHGDRQPADLYSELNLTLFINICSFILSSSYRILWFSPQLSIFIQEINSIFLKTVRVALTAFIFSILNYILELFNHQQGLQMILDFRLTTHFSTLNF